MLRGARGDSGGRIWTEVGLVARRTGDSSLGGTPRDPPVNGNELPDGLRPATDGVCVAGPRYQFGGLGVVKDPLNFMPREGVVVGSYGSSTDARNDVGPGVLYTRTLCPVFDGVSGPN